MAAVNEAYEKGDFEALQRVLEDWDASPESIPGDGIVAELIRVIRRLSQVRTRLVEIEKAIEALRQTDIFVLFKQHEESKSRGEDLLAALVSQASREVSDAKRTLKKLKKEVSKK
jgi:predicted nucleic acid-binding protein